MPTATFADEIRAMSADTVETPPCMFFSHVAGRVKEDAAEPSSCLGAVQNGPSSPPPIQPPCSSEFVTALECNGTMASPSPTGDSNIQFLSDEREQSSRNRIASSPAEPRPHPLISSTDPEGYTEADSPDNQQSSSLKLSSSLSIVSPSQQLTSSESPPQGLFFLHWLSAEKCGNGASAAAALIRDLRSQVVNCQAEINRLKTIVSLQMNSTSCDHGTSVPSLEGRNTTTGRNRLHPNVGQTVRQIASHKKYRAPRRSNSTLSASPIPVALSNKDVIAMISPHIDSHNSTTQPVPKGTASTLEFRSAMTHSSSMSSQSALEQSHATKINKSPESFSHLATASHSSISCAETDTPEQIFGRRAMVPGFLDALRWLEEEADKFSERFPAGNSCSHGREV
ncbi:uncharacterized protein EI90DRAFT_3029681 [Cantharellus anzutake]|uniref:uncharacterized protein n=1 Tax=Cantharellus anzutake TaxID=1750568 RepID=UPI001905B5B2|nr:uncharacterized protein EI90DRAFT_3029681 [Cantharellus anzutake]KAF8342629.1 hypothetical protein EI90DRAFT_3029681 [Cantharellus anzutake]